MKKDAHCHVFMSESVSEGHPDKVADQISDAILDACLAKDRRAHVACETLVAPDLVVNAGEITCRGFKSIDTGAIARRLLCALCREEHRRRRSRRPLPDPGGLRHRRGPSRLHLREDLRDGARRHERSAREASALRKGV